MISSKTQVLTLDREQVDRLVTFCQCNGLEKFFVAKDQGAYIGATVGSEPDQKVIFYFPHCDPEKDEDWYENARERFGGDDFGQFLPVRDLTTMLGREGARGVKVIVTEEFINIEPVRD
jgi:hypothetical protein